MTITTGTRLNIVGSSYLTSSENLVINSGATVNNQGTIILKKNLDNQNPSANSLGSGTVLFSGSAAQQVGGQNIMQHLTVNNASGVSIAGNTIVNGVLTLTSGRVTLSSNHLKLGSAATIGGAPSASNMVVATGSGELRKEFASIGTFLFPVGDATGSAEYSPVTLTFTGGAFTPGNHAGISLTDAAYPGSSTSYLTRYWQVTQSGIIGFSANLNFQYLLTDVSGTEADIFCTKVDALPWITYNASNTALHTVDAHGLSSLGIFTGNVGNGAIPPSVRSLQDKVIAAGMVTCADATQTLLIAGNGTNYWVQNGGSVTHIAGINIIYSPGTRVDAGGYMHGYISTTYCSPYIHPSPNTPGTMVDGEEPATGKTSIFRVFPNPTPGKFTLDLSDDVDPAAVTVDIFDVLGSHIISGLKPDGSRTELSLEGKPTGIYLIQVTSPRGTMNGKIIKR
jgi:hypothetical protein